MDNASEKLTSHFIALTILYQLLSWSVVEMIGQIISLFSRSYYGDNVAGPVKGDDEEGDDE